MMRLVLLVATITIAGGCSSLKTHTAPDYRSKITPVAKLGMCGAGASAAVPAFQEVGYLVVDLGQSTDNPIQYARNDGIPFVAIIEPTGTDGAWWDGMFDFSMRITETEDGTVVWSATGEYSAGPIIDQTGSTSRAMKDMAEDFKENFPPAPR